MTVLSVAVKSSSVNTARPPFSLNHSNEPLLKSISMSICYQPRDLSNPNSLNFPCADVIVAPVIEPGGFRVRMPGHALRDFDTATVRQVICYAGGAEGVAAYRGFNSRIGSAAAHHVPDIRARHRPRPKPLCLADSGPEQRPLAIIRDTSRLDVGIQIFFELVMAGHFIDLTVFLVETQPPAFLLRIVILDGERDDGPDAGEGVRHHGDDGAVAQPHDG